MAGRPSAPSAKHQQPRPLHVHCRAPPASQTRQTQQPKHVPPGIDYRLGGTAPSPETLSQPAHNGAATRHGRPQPVRLGHGRPLRHARCPQDQAARAGSRRRRGREHSHRRRQGARRRVALHGRRGARGGAAARAGERAQRQQGHRGRRREPAEGPGQHGRRCQPRPQHAPRTDDRRPSPRPSRTPRRSSRRGPASSRRRSTTSASSSTRSGRARPRTWPTSKTRSPTASRPSSAAP